MKNTQLEKVLQMAALINFQTAAICQKMWEICIKYRDFAVCEGISLLRAGKLEIFRLWLKYEGWYMGVWKYRVSLNYVNTKGLF
jgi:hypothetical protein